ncbi:MbcA/ParS/Xre antitoxin family protein [Parasalinivibrio latis]|uniref:antitoxin Xre/MbcA/ParS toxin-binding domain-containing protein n=1 Tax=Parasalinivibrio latis TaxID=2952610 RepID=UPI0030E0930E
MTATYQAVAQSLNQPSATFIGKVGLEVDIFSNRAKKIQIIRQGISGSVLEKTVKGYPEQRALFCTVLGTASTNLSRLYKAHLDKRKSEDFLHLLGVLMAVTDLYEGDQALVAELLNTRIPALGDQKPVDLLDTFEGRELVKEYLNKLCWGEFI